MVKMAATYTGELHCEVVHAPSGSRLATDAPKDNQGKGEAFSPTDLVGAALASCILTTLAIVAKRDSIAFEGASAEVEKEMASSSPRRIESLKLKITLPTSIPADYRSKIEHVAHSCPVSKSLHPELKIPIEFIYV
ncbi:MAG: OsmC family protein [Cryobacterium sp.]|nr:OsmC family protein [Oligoflexia bacterium]